MSSKKKSIIWQFATLRQAIFTLEYWKDTLYLNDWDIKILIDVETKDMILGDSVMGEIEYNHNTMSAVIRIGKPEDASGYITKFCAEKTLVHELLHLKDGYIKRDESYESKLSDLMEHRRVEETARALVRARYDLPADFLRDF